MRPIDITAALTEWNHGTHRARTAYANRKNRCGDCGALTASDTYCKSCEAERP